MLPTDVRIRDVQFSYEDFLYRTPIKFGGVSLDRVTLLNVTLAVETAAGQVASGVGDTLEGIAAPMQVIQAIGRSQYVAIMA